MDYSSVLAYKTLFLANRANGTKNQLNEGKNCTGIANGARCVITTSQAMVPLFAVSNCLAKSENTKVAAVAKEFANSKQLKDIAMAVSGNTTSSAVNHLTKTVKFLSKLGLAGNIAYATAKCIDADEENKTRTLMQASGNCAGMYLFEHLYSKLVNPVNENEVKKAGVEILKKLPSIKSVKLTSVLTGIGFVCASLFGCKVGEIAGNSLVRDEVQVC